MRGVRGLRGRSRPGVAGRGGVSEGQGARGSGLQSGSQVIPDLGYMTSRFRVTAFFERERPLSIISRRETPMTVIY